jgi:hypothetical protein
MATSRQLRDSLITFLRQEHRDGTLRADPDAFCSIAFLDHLTQFIEAQEGRCLACDAVAADFTRQIENLQRWVRWLLPRRRGGRP